MTEFELAYMISELVDQITSILEMWIAFSFAVVVAATYPVLSNNSKFMTIVALGYLFYSILTMCLQTFFYTQIADLEAQMREAGFDTSRYHNIFGQISVVGNFLLYTLGTGFVVYFVVRTSSIRVGSNENT